MDNKMDKKIESLINKLRGKGYSDNDIYELIYQYKEFRDLSNFPKGDIRGEVINSNSNTQNGILNELKHKSK